jgi:hypothetical protein
LLNSIDSLLGPTNELKAREKAEEKLGIPASIFVFVLFKDIHFAVTLGSRKDRTDG